MSVIGNMRLLKGVVEVVTSFFGTRRPFIMIVIEPNMVATTHSNMDLQHERIEVLERVLTEMKKAH